MKKLIAMAYLAISIMANAEDKIATIDRYNEEHNPYNGNFLEVKVKSVSLKKLSIPDYSEIGEIKYEIPPLYAIELVDNTYLIKEGRKRSTQVLDSAIDLMMKYSVRFSHLNILNSKMKMISKDQKHIFVQDYFYKNVLCENYYTYSDDKLESVEVWDVGASSPSVVSTYSMIKHNNKYYIKSIASTNYKNPNTMLFEIEYYIYKNYLLPTKVKTRTEGNGTCFLFEYILDSTITTQ